MHNKAIADIGNGKKENRSFQIKKHKVEAIRLKNRFATTFFCVYFINRDLRIISQYLSMLHKRINIKGLFLW